MGETTEESATKHSRGKHSLIYPGGPSGTPRARCERTARERRWASLCRSEGGRDIGAAEWMIESWSRSQIRKSSVGSSIRS